MKFQSFDFLMNHLDKLIDYVKNESKLGNYIEIDLPILDLTISTASSCVNSHSFMSSFFISFASLGSINTNFET